MEDLHAKRKSGSCLKKSCDTAVRTWYLGSLAGTFVYTSFSWVERAMT